MHGVQVSMCTYAQVSVCAYVHRPHTLMHVMGAPGCGSSLSTVAATHRVMLATFYSAGRYLTLKAGRIFYPANICTS